MTGIACNDQEKSQVGVELHSMARALFPICRSITGNGVRETLRLLGDGLPMEVHEVPTGTTVFDWTVPREWNIREAWLEGPDGNRVVDFANSNLHVVNYSTPIDAEMTLEALQPHLHSLPDRPEAIPYKTSYYSDHWGFCLPHRQREALLPGTYRAHIDATLEYGHLSYGEIFLPGTDEREVLLSTHICHPSLANDNLSGMVLLRKLAQYLQGLEHRYSYRLLFVPGTIGAITWLAQNEHVWPRVRHALVLAGLGDKGPFSYKASRQGDAEIDLAILRVLRDGKHEHKRLDYSPDGYDERQYNSLGVGIAAGRLSRTPYGTYPEYHTSGDNLDFISENSLATSFEVLIDVITQLESATYYRSCNPHCEPQLGRRGLYAAIGGHLSPDQQLDAMRWLLGFSDGQHSLADISERSGLPLDLLAATAKLLQQHELLEPEGDAVSSSFARASDVSLKGEGP
ncbi:DUF4910 domain-containing protein [Altererythrobacter sp. Z27]|uniref:DUF4910 domain-containing protein n=1 Tax=Altererythrobacter sp. Z27 TaxID=3461147 RepID=UPI0040445778